MSDSSEIKKVFLKPGEFYWGNNHTEISTLLGSCVSFCFWNRLLKIGGMCHFMLPTRGKNIPASGLEGKYGDEAMLLFLKEIELSNSRISDYEVKLFGGANMFAGGNDVNSVPARNIEMAYELTRKYNLPLISENTGGDKYRKLKFEIFTGNAWLKLGAANM